MTRHFIRRGMLAALPSLSLATNGLACTVLMLKDARGNVWLVVVASSSAQAGNGTYVRAFGQRQGTSTFAAENVFPWEDRQVVTTSQPR